MKVVRRFAGLVATAEYLEDQWLKENGWGSEPMTAMLFAVTANSVLYKLKTEL